MDLGISFVLMGIIIIFSFLSNMLFKRTKMPEPLFLIGMGVLLGFVMGTKPDFVSIAPFLAALVLIVVLLDNGLEFNIFKTMKAVPLSAAFTLGILLANILGIGILASKFLEWPLSYGMLFGTIIAGTTTDIVSILAKQIGMKNISRQLLVIESILNDLQLIVFFAILDIISFSSADISSIAASITLQVPVPIIMGAAFAIGWIYMLGTKIKNNPLAYAATVGILFILYGVCQIIGSGGALAVLTFSLLLGNWKKIMKRFGVTDHHPISRRMMGNIKIVEADISFFIKSFFFVFLGFVFNINGVTKNLIILSVMVMVVILVVRSAATWALYRFSSEFKKDFWKIVFIMPRGYVATILGFLAIKAGIGGEELLTLVLLNVFMTTGVSIAFSLANGLSEKLKDGL